MERVLRKKWLGIGGSLCLHALERLGGLARGQLFLESRDFGWRQREEFIRLLRLLLKVCVEIDCLNDGLWVPRIVLLGNGRRTEQLHPFLGQADELLRRGIETNVNLMKEIGRVTHAPETRTGDVDEINPGI